jgi:hypothetical protein
MQSEIYERFGGKSAKRENKDFEKKFKNVKFTKKLQLL